MNKTAIKNFAIWARNKLIADISYRAGLMGVTADGIQKALPQSTGTTEFYDIGTAEPYSVSGAEVRQRRQLAELICRKEKETNYKTAYKYVIEEVAYTWFNRLIAVRFMEVNDYMPSHIRVLSSDSGKTEPDLVTNPFGAGLTFTQAEQQEIIRLKQENNTDEAFRLLFIKQCNALNEILPALFEKTSDYTELLLNLSVIDQDGVLWHLVHDIPEADFDVERGGQIEIIGWLYQYYNTEPKNEAFAKKSKISKEEVPAVTQLFTPDWIVRYMVENSVGRLWIEHLRALDESADEAALAASFGWKYYLPEAKQEPEVETELKELRKEREFLTPEQITTIDPCMGSGHILVYAFDVLMQIYESAGYGQRDAAGSILEHNLYGLDIDDRAFQLAYFAVMMNARQYNRRILNGEHKPNVYSIQESNGIDRNQLKFFGEGLSETEKKRAITQMTGLLDTFKDAKEYGSILTVDSYDWELLNRFASKGKMLGQMSMDTVGLDDTAEQLKQMIMQGEVLAKKYHVTTTNPPYMAISNGDSALNEYVKKKYPDSKTDFFAVFIEKCVDMLLRNGYSAMITQHAWMFLSSFENLRNKMRCTELLNIAHLGPRAFDEINGEVVQTAAFVSRKESTADYVGTYCRLVESASEQGKEALFSSGDKRYYAKQADFNCIPEGPVSYWLTPKMLAPYKEGVKLLGDIAAPCAGLATGDNSRFQRLWYEVSFSNIGFGIHDVSETLSRKERWYPCNSGGLYRKWFADDWAIVDWRNDGQSIKQFRNAAGKLAARPQNTKRYFKSGLTWNKLATSRFAAKYKSEGYIFDDTSRSAFLSKKEDEYYHLGLLCSKITLKYLSALNPTMSFTNGDLVRIPCIYNAREKGYIDAIVQQNIQISKTDWDSFETSWDFESHPLTKKGLSRSLCNTDSVTLEECFRAWFDECDNRFDQLKANEEEVNRIFIDIYGLQDELTSEVEDKDVTVRRADLQRDIKSLLSYAVGCMFGRYSLRTAGLTYAGGTWDEQKYERFKPDVDNVIPITDEEYLEDDIISRLSEFLKVVYGEETLEENLDFIAKALGNKGDSSQEIIRNYFLSDFFKDHCQTYSVAGSGKRPIYWLFDAGKNHGFKALIYLHRYTVDTIGNLRIDYLHRMQRIYESEMSRMQDMIDHSTNAREIAQATKRREKLAKQLKECWEYDEKLAHLALSRIQLDLDDGVKKNYRKIQTANDGKLYEVLADSKNIMSKE